MVSIAFLTSSRIKLNHAKYLCKKYNINILPYKHIYYGISYIEPRIYDRAELLKRSVEDATIRWKKYRKLTKPSNLFILEDTSVIIDALSSATEEVPGVDIKYWMKDNDFQSVDSLLKASGNNRKARVQSHLVLYLTYELQKKTKKEYIVFTSYSDGFITEQEFKFKTQPIYPWLDDKTFNKWFIPEGYDVPISMLPIEEADKVDFRKGAFDEMINFLNDHKFIHKAQNVVPDWKIGLYPFLVVCGPTCSGKTTSARHLSLKFGFYHIEASDFMYLNYYESHGISSNIPISTFAKEALLKNPNIVVDRIVSFINDIGNKPIIVTGFRSPDEVINLQIKLALDKNYKLVFLNADMKIRFDRWKKRKRDNQPLTYKEFSFNNSIQNEIGLSKIEELDCLKITNDFLSFEEYYNYLETQVNLTNYITEDSNILNGTIKISDSVSLENLIILALLFENIHNDEYAYFTTTKVSHLIFERFKIKKHKDNISRYFNQKYFPYYELKSEDDKMHIRLSPTGVSKGLSILSQIELEQSL